MIRSADSLKHVNEFGNCLNLVCLICLKKEQDLDLLGSVRPDDEHLIS